MSSPANAKAMHAQSLKSHVSLSSLWCVQASTAADMHHSTHGYLQSSASQHFLRQTFLIE